LGLSNCPRHLRRSRDQALPAAWRDGQFPCWPAKASGPLPCPCWWYPQPAARRRCYFWSPPPAWLSAFGCVAAAPRRH